MNIRKLMDRFYLTLGIWSAGMFATVIGCQYFPLNKPLWFLTKLLVAPFGIFALLLQVCCLTLLVRHVFASAVAILLGVRKGKRAKPYRLPIAAGVWDNDLDG